MAKQAGKENKNKNKKESGIVNKESFCATIALFSALLFLILCTRTIIFGEFGFAVHSFLVGVFGYLAYPFVIGLFYVSAWGLFGKRLVKNRTLFFCCVMLVIAVSLIIHTACSLSWFDKNTYLTDCFEKGEQFPKSTVCGVVGGTLVYGVAILTTEIGALIVYGIIAAFLTYVCITVAGKQPKQKPQAIEKGTEKAENVANSTTEIPLYQQPMGQATPAQNVQTQPENVPYEQNIGAERIPMSGYQLTTDEQAYTQNSAQNETTDGYTPTVSQRPGFTLHENDVSNFNSGRAFSPFGTQQSEQEQPTEKMEIDYTNPRAFLFGGTPAENYKRNLIFDPTAKVNTRPNVSSDPPTVNDGYTPSYMDAYQNSVNANVQPARPVKIVNDQSPFQYNGSYGNTAEQAPTPPPVVEVTPKEERPFVQDPTPYTPVSTAESRDPYTLSEPSKDYSRNEREDVAPITPVETTRGEELDRGRGEEYRRHDYMDLFSTENPNVFGGEEETLLDRAMGDGRLDRSISERTFTRDESLFDDRGSTGEDDDAPRGRDGMHLLDDEDPYSLRSDYNRGEEIGLNDVGSFGREVPEPRGRGYDDEIVDVSPRTARMPIEPVTEITPPEPAPAVMPKVTEVAPTPPPPPKPRIIRPYVRVPLDDFDCRDVQPTANDDEVEETKQNIIATLAEFRVNGAEIASVTFGPTVTRYNVAIPRSISPKKVVALDQSIAISLHSSGVNVYPNYEDGVVSIEVPNKERQFVQLGCMLSGDTFVNAKSSSLMFTMGKDVANRKVYGDISKMIHLLVAGSSGSGKSVFLGSLIISLIYKYSPEELRLILIDPKMTEFVLYNGLPHLMINEIITDANKAVQSLNWAIGEMNRRYQLFEKMSRSGTYVVNLDQYNAQVEKAERLPKIVIIIDELADLMLAAKKDMEDRIQNLTQKARAAGIHLIVATQRPSTDVITGVIKSNLPTRVAFYVATDVDSRVILDQTGAQKLLGKGDFLYTMPGLAAPVRVQSAFISPEESQRVVNFIKNNNEAYYDEEATAFINSRGGYAGEPTDPLVGDKSGAVDPIYIEALKYVILSGSASISMIQRKCSTGYSRAGKIIEWMEDMGYISPFDGAKARKVLISKEEFESKYGPL